MNFREELAKELGLGAIAEDTMLDDYVKACEAIAIRYHESEVKKLNIPAVSNSLPVDYLQTEMIKTIKELAKESTAPDKVIPDWMENDIKRGMQWMHKRLTGNDC